jgi:peroxiredoxin
MFCREWLAQLERHQSEIQAAGLRVVAVGIGEPKHAQRYCPTLAPNAECLAGRGTSAHEAYGLHRGSLMQLAGPQVIQAGLRATASGVTQGETTGDWAMLAATFVVGPDGVIRFTHYGQFAGDHPDLKEIFAAARQLPAILEG